MVFISGPRQVGKTTFAGSIVASKFRHPVCFTWDLRPDRQRILRGEWGRADDLLVFDELHKFPKWKALLKGFYDTQKAHHAFLVTGSARLDIFRRGSDSLQGRYHSYRLHPFSVAELQGAKHLPEPFSEIWRATGAPDEGLLASLETFGGFPEPFLKQSQRALRRWHREKIERLFREEITEVENIRNLQSMKVLSDLLPARVGSLLSLNNLANDVQVSHTAISTWMEILESFYYHFRVYPFQGKTIRSLRKEPKLYLWDWSEVEDEAARFENLVGAHLLKFVHLMQDAEGYDIDLRFIRDRDQREVDFLVTVNEKPWFAVEVKLQSLEVSRDLTYFQERLHIPYAFQVVKTPGVQKASGDVRVVSASRFLACLV